MLVIRWGAGVVVAAAAAVLSACASVGTPPGGPPDSMPPHIVAVHPDSGAMVPNLKGDAVIQFDEVIEEMAGGGGGGARAEISAAVSARAKMRTSSMSPTKSDAT